MKKVLLFVISAGLTGLILYKMNIPILNKLKTKINTQVQCILLHNQVKKIPLQKTINKQNDLIYIAPNSNVDQILGILTQKGIINKDQVKPFFCYLKKHKIIPNLQAGYFIIEAHTHLDDLANQLTKPEHAEISITLPEGLRIDQIKKVLTKYLGSNDFSKFNPQEFEQLVTQPPSSLYKKYPFIPVSKSLEGFLFPDTYSFNKFTTTANDVVNTLLNNFQKKALPELNNKMHSKYNLTVYQKLILASIIERETNNKYKERQMVADILLKRLSVNMALQVDATLLYPKKDWTYVLTYQDIHSDNPYNTYTRKGLPPTPICNPGLMSIKAVNNPIPNSYWFYMHDKLGNIHYSTTFSEHITNVNKYIR